MNQVVKRGHGTSGWVALMLGLAVLVLAAPAGAANEDGRICLRSRGTDAATPPAVRLNGVYQRGTSGDPMRDTMAGLTAPMARYLPGVADGAAGSARWLFDGAAEAQAGQLDLAQKRFAQCIAEAAQAKNGLLEAACRNNLGAVAAARGRYAEARSWFERAAQQYRAERDGLPAIEQRQAALAARMEARDARKVPAFPPEQKSAPTLADIRAMREQQQSAMLDVQRDPEIAAVLRDLPTQMAFRVGTELVALNLGNVALALGQWEEAQQHLTRALAGYDGRPPCRPAALDDLLRLRERLPRKDEITALVERYRRAIRLAQDEGGNGVGLLELGVLALGGARADAAAAAPPAPAAPAAAAGKTTPAARGEAEPEVKLFADPLSATSEVGLQDLLARATKEERAGQAMQARRSLATAALRAQAAGRVEVEATAQAALMRLEATAGRPAGAIFHGKRAANLLQALRAGVASLPRNARRSYLREREQVYSFLAQLLMQAQRLIEAERVLQMLKEDEGQQFTASTGPGRYTSLPESPLEAAQRTRIEQAARGLRRADEERAAVSADRTYGILLAYDLARIEQDRLRAATELHAFLERGGKATAADHEKVLRAMPLEFQKPFAALFADRGQSLMAVLRGLNEDAPRFRATPATPQQLAAIGELLRRGDELRTALAPVLEAMRRGPSPTLVQAMEREMEPANMARKGQEQVRRTMEHVARPTPESLAARVQMVQQGKQQWAGAQTAMGLATQAYIAALSGQEDRAALAGVGPALQGAPLEVLDAYLDFVRQQGKQMQAAQRAAPQIRALAATMTPEAAQALLIGRLRDLTNRRGRTGPEPSAQAPGVPTLPAQPSASDSQLISRVQAQLEAAAEQALATTGPSMWEANRAQVAAIAGPASKERSALEPPAMALAEPLGRLWRIDQGRVALEARTLDGLAQSAELLESAKEQLPATADESRGPLAGLSVPTALLYYLPHDNGIDVLLVSAQGRQAWRLPVARAEFDRRIGAFSLVLRDAATDPRPAAGTLHDLLFAPVAAAVAQTRAEVIALSLSGKLRFVPFAALHDGRGWLAERYAFALNPGGRLADTLKQASPRWQVAAFGASKGGANLPSLHGVSQELEMVVQQGQRGALPGRQWLDSDFTAEALRLALASATQVVHIASHFKFEPGDAAQSFLLLGDGHRLSLKELGGPEYRFDRTELVTLSACQTGVSADDAFGQEVDGLAALLMAQGAPSVLASLWQVADGSTAQLMGAMYGLHAQRGQRPMGRAQALQQAQLTMIRSGPPEATAAGGTLQPTASASQRGIGRPQDSALPQQAQRPGSTHPYHWAPFVLMGSWQ